MLDESSPTRYSYCSSNSAPKPKLDTLIVHHGTIEMSTYEETESHIIIDVDMWINYGQCLEFKEKLNELLHKYSI